MKLVFVLSAMSDESSVTSSKRPVKPNASNTVQYSVKIVFLQFTVPSRIDPPWGVGYVLRLYGRRMLTLHSFRNPVPRTLSRLPNIIA